MQNTLRKKESNFTVADNNFLRNGDLTFKAKGLFLYMLSMADGWNFTINSIAKQQKDGKASVSSAIDELKAHGYIVYEKHSNGYGTYHLIENPYSENQVMDEPKPENPDLGFPTMGKSECIKKEKLVKKEKLEEKKIQKKDFSINDLVSENVIYKNVNIEAATEWLEHKNLKSKSAVTKLLNFLSRYDHIQQQEIIDTSIMNGWKGLFAPKNNNIAFRSSETKSQRTCRIIDEVFDEAEAIKRSRIDDMTINGEIQ